MNIGEARVAFMHCSLNDASKDILMYKFYGNSEWQEFRKIKNPNNKSCFTINYYYDENLAKTMIFFGFSKDFVKIYSISENSWETSKQFKTHGFVFSINFILGPQINNNDSINKLEQISNSNVFKNKIVERFIIYTYKNNNLIILGDINTGAILKELNVPNVKCIRDLCVWRQISEINGQIRKTYLIAISEINVSIINFEDYSVVYSKDLSFKENTSVIKTKVVLDHGENEQKEYKEAVVLFSGLGNSISISFY